MAYVMEEEKDRTIPEDTIVRAVLVEVSEKQIEWKDKRTNEDRSATLLEWWFEVVDDREDALYQGRKVKLECDARLTNHPNNRFRLVVEALLGRELSLGTPIDPQDDLVGLKCDITVKHRRYEKDGVTKVAEEIDEVIGLLDDGVPF
jgi:hypothetical protein